MLNTCSCSGAKRFHSALRSASSLAITIGFSIEGSHRPGVNYAFLFHSAKAQGQWCGQRGGDPLILIEVVIALAGDDLTGEILYFIITG